MAILIPEIEIHNTLKAVLTLIRLDFEQRSNEQDTILYKLLGANKLQRYELFEQAKTVFLVKEDNPRFLDVQMFFNMKRASIPTIHITLPSENPGQDGLGIDEGFQGYDESPGIGDGDLDQTAPNYTRRFDTKYNLIITSDNTNEVILIYHLLRAILIPVFDHFNQLGIENCKLSGGDIQNNNTLVPDHIFMRNIGLAFSYEVTSQGLFRQDIIQRIILEYEIVIEPDPDPSCLAATYEVRYVNGTLIEDGTIASGESKTIVVPNPTSEESIAVLKDTLGNIISTTIIPPGATEIIIAPNSTIKINGNLLSEVVSGSIFNIDIIYENLTPVGTIVGNTVIIPNPNVCADATYNIKDSDGTTLYSGSIASGGDLQQQINDSPINNSDNSYLANVVAEGSLELPDVVHTTINNTPITLPALTPFNATLLPLNIVLPLVTGVPRIGEILTSTFGSWNNNPTSYSCQWKRNGANIGTNANTYTVVLDDINSIITCHVSAINSVGSVIAISNELNLTYTNPETAVQLILFKANEASDYVLTGNGVDRWINKGINGIDATATANKPTKDGTGNWLNFASASAQKLLLQTQVELNCNQGWSLLIGLKQVNNDVYLIGNSLTEGASMLMRISTFLFTFNNTLTRTFTYTGWDTKKTGRFILEVSHLGASQQVVARMNNGVPNTGSGSIPSNNRIYFDIIGGHNTGTQMNGQIGFVFAQNKPFTVEERNAYYNYFSQIYVPE